MIGNSGRTGRVGREVTTWARIDRKVRVGSGTHLGPLVGQILHLVHVGLMVEVGGTVDGEDVVSEIHRFGLVLLLLLLEVLAGENASNGGTRHGDDLGHRLRLDSGSGLVSERRVEADASFCDRRCDAKRGVGAFCERARRGSALRCRRRFSQTDVGRQNKGPLGLFGKNERGAP